ncbi:MAG: DUF192 domain-containing protein [bacterium]|nr:DUF192 domain-containing protein [bacterium]
MKINIRSIIILSLLILPFIRVSAENKEFEEKKIQINENILIVEIADTDSKREKGLMFREKLDENRGMLFIFETPHYYTFWMENTKIPLSLAFIDQDFKITEIVDLKPLDTTLAVPSKKISYVLEMNKGWFKKNKVKAGDIVNGIKKESTIR